MAKKIPPAKQAKITKAMVPSPEPVPLTPEPPPVPVVGIGASAGGLEAFRELLEALPSNTGMAFVLVSHLSRNFKSMLSELLSKNTQMPVVEVRVTTRLEANHVYVIQPNAALTIEDGSLISKPIQESDRPSMVIDKLFRSIAEHRKGQAIGVVLSGTGTDGMLGLAAIKAEGGIAFAQDEETAKYPDMPRSASAQFGGADFVLPPAQIARQLALIAGHPYVRVIAEPIEPSTESQIASIFQLVKRTTGLDFSQYKPTTLQRRILRRMVLKKTETIAAYRKLMDTDPAEVEALYQDLLIHVTSFFRDPETFEYLEREAIPDILKHRKGDLPIRVWVPGCATGEEAYSIAIVLLEAFGKSSDGAQLVQIFATDVSKQAVQTARDGRYSGNIEADVSPERLARFFVRSGDGYQINRFVRDLCIFAAQDVTKDPPFSRLDLIICRNLLIYLGVPLQKRVFATFHYALNNGGYLFLGTSETVEAGSDAFRQVNKKYKLYTKLLTSALPPFEFHPAELGESPMPRRPRFISQPATDLGKEADRIVLAKYSPPGVLINSSFEILQFRGHTGAFLEPPPGQVTLNLLKMARDGLAIDLRALVHHAKKTREVVRKSGVRVPGSSGFSEITVEVTPVLDRSTNEPYYLVLFEPAERASPQGKASPAARGGQGKDKPVKGGEMAALRGELAGTQEDLRSIIEEQEATNEELQSANEEILSSNEEFQSTNEELETSKEELQATNEELLTLNEEMQTRNVELAKVNSDLTNLIESAEVVYVMLDSNLRIRRFTSAAQKVLNLIATDIGRPIADIKPNIQVDNLPAMIRASVESSETHEETVQDMSGRSYFLRIRPSQAPDGKIEGAVLALTDVEALLRSQENRQGLERSLRSLLKNPPDLLLATAPEGRCLFANCSVMAGAQLPIRSIFEYLAPQDREPMRRSLHQALETRTPSHLEVREFSLRPGKSPMILKVEPILTPDSVLALSVRLAQPPSDTPSPAPGSPTISSLKTQ